MSKNQSLKKTAPSKDQNFGSSDNHGKSIWYEIDKANKTGKKGKSLLSTFACFLTAIAKV